VLCICADWQPASNPAAAAAMETSFNCLKRVVRAGKSFARFSANLAELLQAEFFFMRGFLKSGSDIFWQCSVMRGNISIQFHAGMDESANHMENRPVWDGTAIRNLTGANLVLSVYYVLYMFFRMKILGILSIFPAVLMSRW
jgi:hypothetical protein